MDSFSKQSSTPSFLGIAYLEKVARIVEEKAKVMAAQAAAKVAPEVAEKIKDSEDVSDLKPHHQAVLKKLDKSHGVIAAHSLGSGKTLLLLRATQRALDREPAKRGLIVAPASLVTNVDKEMEKFKIKIDKNRLDVMSYQMAASRADQLRKNKYAIAVADEAHALRNPETARVKSLSEIFEKADNRLLTTATPNYNHISDTASLVNIAAGDKILPDERKVFENRYLRKVQKPRSFLQVLMRKKPEEYVDLKNEDELKEIFKKHVHVYDAAEDPAAADKFPEQTEKVIEVPMSSEQQKYYKYMENKLPFMIKMKVRWGLPMDKSEKASLNSFSTGVRQVSTGYRNLSKEPDEVEYTPKIQAATENLQKAMHENPNFRGLVYSNYLDAGVKEYSRKLKDLNISHAVYTGELSKEQKDKVVEDYNAGKTPVMIVSSSGAEGLNLKRTRLVQILESHFNKSKIQQVAGRAARYESHTDLPKDQQNVEVQHYLSVHPKNLMSKTPLSIDRYLHDNSEDKNEMFEKIKNLMKESN